MEVSYQNQFPNFLPLEITMIILEKLSLKDQKVVEFVCKLFKNILHAPPYFKAFRRSKALSRITRDLFENVKGGKSKSPPNDLSDQRGYRPHAISHSNSGGVVFSIEPESDKQTPGYVYVNHKRLDMAIPTLSSNLKLNFIGKTLLFSNDCKGYSNFAILTLFENCLDKKTYNFTGVHSNITKHGIFAYQRDEEIVVGDLKEKKQLFSFGVNNNTLGGSLY